MYVLTMIVRFVVMLKNLLIVMVVLSYASNLAKAANLTQNDMDDISKIENYLNSVSYTHLTLPTKRIV